MPACGCPPPASSEPMPLSRPGHAKESAAGLVKASTSAAANSSADEKSVEACCDDAAAVAAADAAAPSVGASASGCAPASAVIWLSPVAIGAAGSANTASKDAHSDASSPSSAPDAASCAS